MYFKYRKLIITTSCSIMLFGMVIFSTKNPIGMRAANVAESSNTKSVVKNESDVNRNSRIRWGSRNEWFRECQGSKYFDEKCLSRGKPAY